MSELTWAKLNLLDVNTIEDAAARWSRHIDRLTEAADAVEKDVAGIIDEASFGGQAGEGCRSQLRAIGYEVRDHLDEAAKQIKAVLVSSGEDLGACKTQMQTLVDEVLTAKLRIREDGEVYLSEARIADIEAWAEQQAADGSGSGLDYTYAEIGRVEETECRPLTERIRRLVERAKGYDDEYTARLHAIRDAYPQMPPPLGSDWHEDVAAYWSDRAVHLLNGGTDGVLDGEELDQFNDIVAEHADSPAFATRLMNALGPAGLTTHLADVVVEVYYREPESRRFTPAQVSDMYQALGLALATATDPTNDHHVTDQWVAELMNLGGSNVTTSDGRWQVTGYELLAPALPHGRFHEDFLVPVTEHMLAIDHSRGWGTTPLTEIADDHPEIDNGYNPVNWALVALDHNPQAAINLFAGGGTHLADTAGVNLDGLEPVADPFAYLMDRADDPGFPTTTAISPDLLGNALQSATTGVSTNPAYPPDTPPVPTDRMASLADRLIERVTANPDEFTSGPKSRMIDNFGAITTAYIDDFHQAMGVDPLIANWAVDEPGADLALGSPGTDNERLASDWLRIVGHDEAATAQVWGASEELMYHQLEKALAHDNDQILHPFGMHGEVTAALTFGTLDAIVAGEFQRAADHNRVIDLFAEGASFGADIAVSLITRSKLAGAAVGQATGYGLDRLFEFTRMSEEEVQARIEELASWQLELNQDNMTHDATEAHIRQILGTDPELSEEDIDGYVNDYYERYWEPVSSYYSGTQNR